MTLLAQRKRTKRKAEGRDIEVGLRRFEASRGGSEHLHVLRRYMLLQTADFIPECVFQPLSPIAEGLL